MRRGLGIWTLAAVIAASQSPAMHAEVWQPTAGLNLWGVPENWSPASVPNGVGATAQFSVPTTAVNTASVEAAYTVGNLLFDTTGSIGNNDYRIADDEFLPGGTLTLDDTDDEATITVQGTGIPNVDLQVPIVLADTVVANVNTLSSQSAAGALNIEDALSGPGGFIKRGDGTLTFITTAKTYTGATSFEAGKIRLRSSAATPTMSSSVRIMDGAWIEPGFNGTLQLGAGTVFLNGDGQTGTFSAPGGAIRPDRTTTEGRVVTIPNNIVLESDSSIHSQTQNDTTLGSITLSGIISGPGQLQLTHTSHNEQIGSYILTNTNTYTGGTELRAGTLRLSGAGATLGMGDVYVLNGRFLADRVTEINGAAIARLVIESGVTDAIDDDSTLRLGGGFNVASQKAGFAELQSGVNETVGGLILGDAAQLAPGTYGSSTSGAMFVFDEYFTGDGLITLDIDAPVNDADFDNDNDVDGEDFLIWQRGVGVGTDNMTGDANGSGTVDGADLDVWETAFGTGGAGSPAVAAIPEPATLVLTILAGSLALFACRRK